MADSRARWDEHEAGRVFALIRDLWPKTMTSAQEAAYCEALGAPEGLGRFSARTVESALRKLAVRYDKQGRPPPAAMIRACVEEAEARRSEGEGEVCERCGGSWCFPGRIYPVSPEVAGELEARMVRSKGASESYLVAIEDARRLGLVGVDYALRCGACPPRDRRATVEQWAGRYGIEFWEPAADWIRERVEERVRRMGP